MEKRSLHIVVFPWLAFGHMLPYLELSKSLAIRGHRVTYISTPRNIERLPKIPSHLSPLIQLVSFTLPHVEHLPYNAESTRDVPPKDVHLLKKAHDGLDVPFSTFLESTCSEKDLKPDWIIIDFTHHWIPKIAQQYSIPCTLFCTYSTSTSVFFGPPSELQNTSRKTPMDFTAPPNWIPFPSNIAYRLHEIRSILMAEQNTATGTGTKDAERLRSAILGSEFICIRTCFPLESKWLTLLAKLYSKPVVPIGLLLPSIDATPIEQNTIDEVDVMDWLDGHDAKSVLYIAFGSEATLTPNQFHELALALEISKVHFLWALRIPGNAQGDSTGILPEGFIERTKEFGLVVMSWVPQIRVLSHESLGGFFSHCGWSSIIEALQFGHPLILLPLSSIDQGLNSRILEEKELGVEIKRNEENGSFQREDVAKVIRLIMVEEEGKVFRRNAEREKTIFDDKISHDKHFDDFVAYLENFESEN